MTILAGSSFLQVFILDVNRISKERTYRRIKGLRVRKTRMTRPEQSIHTSNIAGAQISWESHAPADNLSTTHRITAIRLRATMLKSVAAICACNLTIPTVLSRLPNCGCVGGHGVPEIP